MSAVVFGKGVLTYTFLVMLEDMDLEELQRPIERNEEEEALWLEPEPEPDPSEIPTIPENPEFWASVAVSKLFHDIITRTRPQNVVVTIRNLSKESDAPHVAAVRQKIERGEMGGQLVTVILEITRPDLTRPYLTRPELLPFPGLSWLTHQVRDEPGRGIRLLYVTAAQEPM